MFKIKGKTKQDNIFILYDFYLTPNTLTQSFKDYVQILLGILSTDTDTEKKHLCYYTHLLDFKQWGFDQKSKDGLEIVNFIQKIITQYNKMRIKCEEIELYYIKDEEI